jgi:hypothetical protein
MEQLVNSKIELTELANKLFMYTDAQQWDLLLSEVFTDTVELGNTRSFTGSYELKALETNNGWRISQFKYNLKFAEGNIEFR